jgi:hypothetical protein
MGFGASCAKYLPCSVAVVVGDVDGIVVTDDIFKYLILLSKREELRQREDRAAVIYGVREIMNLEDYGTLIVSISKRVK